MAHHYPSTPLYGQYPAAPYYPPPVPHPQQQAMRPPPGGFQPNMQNSSAPPPYFIPPRFDGHPQVPSPNAFPQFPPASFTPEMFRHFGTPNLQPPPPSSLPPLPLPNLGFAPFPQQPQPNQYSRPQNITAYDGAQSSTLWTSSAEQPENKIHTAPNQGHMAFGDSAKLPGNTSEDGELSDGEIEGSADAFANQSSRTISHDDAAMPSDPNHWTVGQDASGASMKPQLGSKAMANCICRSLRGHPSRTIEVTEPYSLVDEQRSPASDGGRG
jgi:hypothetical protein